MTREHGHHFLRATAALDWTEPAVQTLARDLGRVDDPVAVAQRCFTWVRDEIPHTVDIGASVVPCAASAVLRAGTGFCYAKSHLLVALLRANQLPAGLCYQGGFGLHGLAAVWLPAAGWYRIDPRGNRPGIDARFTPPAEQLAFPVRQAGERLFPGIHADPAPLVLRALRSAASADALSAHLPDAVREQDLAGVSGDSVTAWMGIER
jgi:transglutaminase-like putative cysteine protease